MAATPTERNIRISIHVSAGEDMGNPGAFMAGPQEPYKIRRARPIEGKNPYLS
jgi:hypothetical protein